MSRFTLADIFSVLNAIFGLLAIYHLHESSALFFLLLAVLCDGLDGFVSRRTAAEERQGIVMDSLADSVSFVIFPALCVFSLQSSGLSAFFFSFSAFLYVWCGLYRLSRFTAYDSELGAFAGLPTPEAALLLVLLITVLKTDIFAIPFSVFLSLLMISSAGYPKIRGRLSLFAGAVILLSVVLFFVWSSFLYVLFFLLLVYLASPIFSRSGR